jgi:putative transposase
MFDHRCTTNPIPFNPKPSVREEIRRRVRGAIEAVLDEELEATLGAARYQRTDQRTGFRNGSHRRTVTTEQGPTTLTIPRGRVMDEHGRSREWRSELLPRYQRRTAQVDEAILGSYLAGSGTRRIKRALEPLLGESSLSKSAISRIVGRLKSHFEQWSQRDLSGERYAVVYLDAIRLPIRMAGRVVKVPVQAALGVTDDGQKVLISMSIAASESTAAWTSSLRDLVDRHLPAPMLVVIDGCKGLRAAVREAWPEALVQRCTKHKLENLLAKAPKHSHDELKRDYRAITHAASASAARAAYASFLTKWRRILASVAASLEEAGEELLTFTRFPKSQWKSLRTTNVLERVNGEFRRRTKTQGSFRHEQSALTLLFGLIAMGQLRLRKIDGWRDLSRWPEIVNTAA